MAAGFTIGRLRGCAGLALLCSALLIALTAADNYIWIEEDVTAAPYPGALAGLNNLPAGTWPFIHAGFIIAMVFGIWLLVETLRKLKAPAP